MSDDCQPGIPMSEGPGDPPCVGVTNCDGPLEVTVVNQSPHVDSELVCNADTGVYDLVTITSINGVPSDPSVTPTALSCDEGDPPLDVETFDRCVEGVLHQITVAFDAAGDETILRDVDTGIECNGDVKIGNECPDSIPVKQCPDDPPFEVTIVDDPTPQITVEAVCIDGTVHILKFEDGDQTDDIDTGTACDDDTDIDVEYQCQESTGTIHAVTFVDGAALASTADTGRECPKSKPDCVESQQYTFGIDNTGSAFNQDEIYELENDDGSIITITAPASSGNTPQMLIWQSEIEAGAAALGITGWLVSARFINNWPAGPNYANGVTDISGGFGLPGPTSAAAAIALDNGGMYARYMDIQVCPGSVLPKTFRLVSRGGNPVDPPRPMAQAGPILGPIQKFQVCKECGEAPVYFYADGVTPVPEGQEPFCGVPCGTSQLTPAPIGADCTPFLETHCDDNGSDDSNDWTSITRQVIYCPGEDPALTYYEDDGNGGLIEVALNGLFVDCDTGQPVGLPEPPCSDFVSLGNMYMIDAGSVDGNLRNREWHDTAPVAPVNSATALEDCDEFKQNHDFSLPPDTDTLVSSLALNDTDNAASELDIQVLEGFIVVDSQMDLRYSGASEGCWIVEVGECCGPLAQVAQSAGFFSGREMTFSVPPGIHKVRIWNIDSGGSNSSATLGYSNDGGATWINDNTPPGLAISTTKPDELCIPVVKCLDSGALVNPLDDKILDPDLLSPCRLACDPNTALLSQLVKCICGEC